ncbi:MAG: HNH endonuclease [Methylobacillus sp.]|nr:HNH endonuclease [Methylobacillus sp.]
MQIYKRLADITVVPIIKEVAKYVVAKPFELSQPMKVVQLHESAFAPKGNWTRAQTILAFHFYCQTQFGQLHSRNRKIIELAAVIGRTPSALAMKCVNIASLDPAIRESGRTGLSNASVLDREIWEEFHGNWEGLVEQAEALLQRVGLSQLSQANDDELNDMDFTGEMRVVLVKRRIKQDFFRRSVLSSYSGKCCISGVSDSRFLVASHIVAWKDDVTIRLNPANGLCLSVIHDKAFDKNLFSLTDDHRIILSKQLQETNDQFLRDVFWKLNDTTIELPEKFVPEPEFLARHRKKMLAN